MIYYFKNDTDWKSWDYWIALDKEHGIYVDSDGFGGRWYHDFSNFKRPKYTLDITKSKPMQLRMLIKACFEAEHE